jgi:hypothetical protein
MKVSKLAIHTFTFVPNFYNLAATSKKSCCYVSGACDQWILLILSSEQELISLISYLLQSIPNVSNIMATKTQPQARFVITETRTNDNEANFNS